MRTAKTILVWFLQVAVGLLFVVVGVLKFTAPMWARNFARWGYPDGFYMIVGVLEAAGGLALLIPAVTTYAAAFLAAVMAAAALTHVVHSEMQRVSVPLVYLLLVGLVGWSRRASAWRPGRRRSPQSALVI